MVWPVNGQNGVNQQICRAWRNTVPVQPGNGDAGRRGEGDFVCAIGNLDESVAARRRR
jgi:hypothetical protein